MDGSYLDVTEGTKVEPIYHTAFKVMPKVPSDTSKNANSTKAKNCP